MATYRAIAATCEAIVSVLRQSWRPELFNDAPLTFQVYRTDNFTNPMTTGVSLFLYDVTINAVQRTPPGKLRPDGRRKRPELPLDLHFILTPWAREASLEQEILGWMMRTLEDFPLLGSGLLNAFGSGIFTDEESVEVLGGQLSREEMFRIWDVLPGDYRISMPYIARVVRIESELDTRGDGIVLTRDLGFGVVRD
jgi:hypothetical protein